VLTQSDGRQIPDHDQDGHIPLLPVRPQGFIRQRQIFYQDDRLQRPGQSDERLVVRNRSILRSAYIFVKEITCSDLAYLEIILHYIKNEIPVSTRNILKDRR
jgi:hypothetical protein